MKKKCQTNLKSKNIFNIFNKQSKIVQNILNFIEKWCSEHFQKTEQKLRNARKVCDVCVSFICVCVRVCNNKLQQEELHQQQKNNFRTETFSV